MASTATVTGPWGRFPRQSDGAIARPMPSHMITYRLALFVRIGSVAASAVAGLMWRRVGEQRFVSLVSGPPGKDTIQGEVGQTLHQQRQCGDEFGIGQANCLYSCCADPMLCTSPSRRRDRHLIGHSKPAPAGLVYVEHWRASTACRCIVKGHRRRLRRQSGPVCRSRR